MEQPRTTGGQEGGRSEPAFLLTRSAVICTKVHYQLLLRHRPSNEELMSITLLPQPTPQRAASQPPRLLDQVAQAARHRSASEPTTTQLVAWVLAYVLFHNKRHSSELNLAAVTQFLEHVVRTQRKPLPAARQGHRAFTRADSSSRAAKATRTWW
jgi:hypothetical protein